MGMMDQPGTDRPEQAAMPARSAAASDHHQEDVFGHIDKGRHSAPKEQFTIDLRSITAGNAVLDDPDRVRDDPAGSVLLNLENLLRNSAGRPHQRRRRDLQRGGDDDSC